MASSIVASLAFLLTHNLILFTSVSSTSCSVDLGVCVDLLGGLLGVTVGTPPKTPCCPLIQGLVDAEVAACLCTAVKADVAGIKLNLPIDLSLLFNYCGQEVAEDFTCD